MFLGVTAEVADIATDGNAFSLIITDNPLSEFVELPPMYANLHYRYYHYLQCFLDVNSVMMIFQNCYAAMY